MKKLQIPQKLCTENFTHTNKFHVHEIAAVDLSKIYFLKNAKKTCKPNNRNFNRDWIRVSIDNGYKSFGNKGYYVYFKLRYRW